MAHTQLEPMLDHIRGMLPVHFEDSSDRELLEAYSNHQDPNAFTSIVQRYSRLVFGVCRRYAHSSHDVEDVFQATFFVLAKQARSIRKGCSLASWLHGVAYRIAMNAKREAGRRNRRERVSARDEAVAANSEMMLQESLVIIDEEIRRLPEIYRSTFVLCCLENHTKAEAATRLGAKEGTVSSRLAQARKILSDRLTKRGITLGSVLAGLRLTDAPLSAGLVESSGWTALEFAGGCSEAIPSKILALANGVSGSSLLAKSGVLSLCLLALALFAGVGFGLPSKGQKEPSKAPGEQDEKRVDPDERTVRVRGVVTNDSGKPVAGATVRLRDIYAALPKEHRESVKTDANGLFEIVAPRVALSGNPVLVASKNGLVGDWLEVPRKRGKPLSLRLGTKDVPLRGRLLDLEGQPIDGATVRLVQAQRPREHTLDKWIDWQRQRAKGISIRMAIPAARELIPSTRIRGSFLLGEQQQSKKTGTDGRFEFSGVGAERVATIEVSGPGIERTRFQMLTRRKPKDKPNQLVAMPRPFSVHYAETTVAVGPGQTIRGVLRDSVTKIPVEGISVSADSYSGNIVVTNAKGEYSLEGLPVRKEYTVNVGGKAYLYAWSRVRARTDTEPIEANIDLIQGVFIEGRVVDKKTGKPIRAAVQYLCRPDNPFLKDYPESGRSVTLNSVARTKLDGTFQVLGIPGPARLGVTAKDANAYAEVYIEGWNGSTIPLVRGGVHPSDFHSIIEIDVPKDAKQRKKHRIELTPGKTRKGTVVDDKGKPLAGVYALGLEPRTNSVEEKDYLLENGEFVVSGLRDEKVRSVLFFDPKRKMSKVIRVRPGDNPMSVKLKPFGSVKGRLLDSTGKPLAGVDVRVEMNRRFSSNKDLPFGPLWTFGNHFYSTTKTDAEGRFRLEGMVPGVNHSLRVTRPRVPAGEMGLLSKDDIVVTHGETLDLGTMKQKQR